MWIFILQFSVLLALLFSGPSALAQDHGSGSTTHGDIFGDLYHIKRDATTGQPILQKRWIEYPGDEFDWGYCVIPVDVLGNEIPFVPLSCEVDPESSAAVVEVDYFGRLSMGRSKESNLRMHFDEVITKINGAQIIDRDPSGRFKVATNCEVVGNVPVPATCTWKLVDSPGENLAMYWRLLRYGHFQTDPLEEDTSPGGDPAAGTVYRPALTQADYAKFSGVMQALLPVPPAQAASCFSGEAFTCDEPQLLDATDFGVAASFLATAADKTGRVTPDLLQYLHRILKITQTTAMGAATLRTLPALIRDCGSDPDEQIEDVSLCPITPAPDEPDPDAPATVKERFVDYAVVTYERADWFDHLLDVLKPYSAQTWIRASDVSLLGWLGFINPGLDDGTNITGFVNFANDALRTVQFLHEYELPADLGWDFNSIIVENPALVVMGLVANKSAPQPVGTTITFVATAAGGTPPIQFKFLLSNGTTTTVLQEWSSLHTFAWTPKTANQSYVVSVWARSAGSSLDAPEKINAQAELAFPIGSALTITSLTALPASPQPAGTQVAFAVVAGNGVLPYEYKWDVKTGDVWSTALDWGPAATFNWTAPADGTYGVRANVRDAGGLEDSHELQYVVAPAPPPPPPPPPPPATNAPIAGDDGYTTTVNTPLLVSAPGVLGNDDPLGGGALSATLQSTVANGALNFNGDGSFTYVPNATFSGADAFTYRTTNQNGTSNIATASILVSMPKGPYGLHAESISGNTVRLDWSAPPGMDVTNYVIDGGAAPGAVGASLSVGNAQPTLTFQAPTGVYYAHVHAVAADVVSPESNEIKLYVGVPAPPGAPMNLVGLATGSALSLTWHNSYEGGEPTAVVLDVVGPITTSIPLGLVNTMTYGEVPPGTYTFTVRAVNAVGSSGPSNPVSLTFPAGCSGAPQTPMNFAAYKTGTVITAMWDPPAAGSAPTGYVLQVVGDFTGSFPTTAQSLSGEVAPGSYGLSVTAINVCGVSTPTGVVTIVVP
jgi:hypothetical protein